MHKQVRVLIVGDGKLILNDIDSNNYNSIFRTGWKD